MRLLLVYAVTASLAWELYLAWRRANRARLTPPSPSLHFSAERRYMLLLGVNLLCCVILIVLAQPSGLLFFLSLGLFATLVILPALLGPAIRRALAANRLGIALRLAIWRSMLQPSPVAHHEREMLAILALVREGHTDDAVKLLQGRLPEAGAVQRIEIHEQIIAALCFDRRFEDAILYFESHVPHMIGDGIAHRPALAAHMVRAYSESGKVAHAAEILLAMRAGPAAQDPAGLDLILQSVVVVLASAGCVEELDDLTREGKLMANLPPQVRAYWRGLTLLRANRIEAGTSELLRSRALAAPAERSLREAIDERMKKMPAPPISTPSHEIVAEMVKWVADARVLPRLRSHTWRTAPVTAAIAATLALAFLLVEGAGSSQDTWFLVRVGAQFRPAVIAGEYWRLVTATFLHAGLLHLVLNTYGLWVLGRLVEQVFGSARFFALYLLPGIVGFAASAMVARVPISVGASGCIFGLLGAAIAMFAARRGTWPEHWRKSVLGSLVFFALINLVIGFHFPMIDNAAHLGGLACGVVLGFVLLPAGPFGAGRMIRAIAALLVLISLGAIGFAAVGLVHARAESLLSHVAMRGTRLGNVELRHPDYWKRIHVPELGEVLVDALGGGMLNVEEFEAPVTVEEVLERAGTSIEPGTTARGTNVRFHQGIFLGRELLVSYQGEVRARQVWASETPRGILLVDFSFPLQASETYRPLLRKIIASAKIRER